MNFNALEFECKIETQKNVFHDSFLWNFLLVVVKLYLT